jgi:acyl transferase domain-containing protein/NADPH:quinone reductase-like Zn-dependent oxidoreductase/NADP-dependent 3-hydroxy acid dehydrogenase YdfG/ubiquinone/menaquinone biosynthesis C-methylase UbiE/acyl carrier protein
MSSFDYSLIQIGFRDRHSIDVYTNTGGALSIAANRISYCLNLRGPSVVVDTACSSALTAVHCACESIRKGECTTALAGGVHVLITPGPYLGFSKLAMLSADGRCKAFDARGNGFVRSEGAGMVLLKPLTHALADRDQIYALIRSSAINQDGRTSGLTVPSAKAQEDLVREACLRAGVDPRQIKFVEAHGTGTLVGDPIEARALGAVLAPGRSEGDYCLIGSVKTNVGHLEAAAGVVGLVKTALALKHQQVPPNLHFEEPNPHIPFDELRLRVPTTLEPWPPHEGPALAGVNSFGFGGSNAHVLLQEPPQADDLALEPLKEGRPQLVPLAARSPEALRALAGCYQQFLASKGAGTRLGDFLHTTRCRRTHHEYRLGVVAGSTAELAEQLGAFAAQQARPSVVSDRVVPGHRISLAFVFSGQGPQWWAMGRQLLTDEPVFRAVVQRCDECLRGLGSDWSLLVELTRPEAESRIENTAIAQPAIFALQAGLAALWRSWGVKPEAVVGHSVGEVAAAHVAGVFSLEEATRVIYHRGRLMALAGGGRMLAVGLSIDDVQPLLAPHGGRVTVAAVNGPASLTLSGDAEPLLQIHDACQAAGKFSKFLPVEYAFHSAHMDPIRDQLLESLAGLAPARATLPLVSTVTGNWTDGTDMDASYWWRNVRQAVQFAPAVRRLIDNEHNTVLEIGPHPVLASSVVACSQAVGKKVTVVPSLRRKEPERAQLLCSLGALYAVGYPVDWALQEGTEGRFVRLPTYPWQHESYWHESEESRDSRLGTLGCHPLLGRALKSPVPSWSGTLDPNWQGWLNDHKVQGQVLVPGAAYLELGMAAAKEVLGIGHYVLEDVRFVKGCFLPGNHNRSVRTTFDPQSATLQIHTQPFEADQPWVYHAGAVLRSRQDDQGDALFVPADVQARCLGSVAGAECYEVLRKVGLDYGPTFQGVERLWVGNGEALGRISLSADLVPQLEQYHFHPAALDACLQVVLGTLARLRRDDGQGVYLPVEIEEVRVLGRPGQVLWSHAQLVELSRQGLTAALKAYDENGRLVLEMRNLRCQYLGGDGSPVETLDDLLYEFCWQLKPRQGREAQGRRLGGLPPLPEVAAEVAGLVERLVDPAQKSRYEGFEAALKDLCGAFMALAINRLASGVDPLLVARGARFAADDLAERLKVAAQHRRLFRRYLGHLAEDGVLRHQPAVNGSHGSPEQWEVVRDLRAAYREPRQHWLELLQRNPAFFAELTLIGRCGQSLAEVLQDTVNPLQLIFPDGSLAIAEHLYSDSPSTRFYNTLAQSAIERVLAHLPADRLLRVLEIGAGTGGLTSYLLPRLPADRTEYVFTDLSNHFLGNAQQRFGDFAFVSYKKLDVEKDPVEQGFAEHSFDIVVASQVLHATTDLRNTVTNARRLLADDGLLVLLESVTPGRWIDLVFGLTEGWWRFADTDLRPEYPLLSYAGWRKLLGETGFGEVVDASASPALGGYGSAVILARCALKAASSSPTPAPVVAGAECAPVSSEAKQPGHWLIFADRGGVGASLAGFLRGSGEQVVLVYPPGAAPAEEPDAMVVAPDRVEDMKHLLGLLARSGRLPRAGIVHLWNLDAPAPDDLTAEGLDEVIDLGCLSVVHLVQAWAEQTTDESRLWLVTRGTQSVQPGVCEPINMGQTMVWGLGRVLCNEFPKLRCKMVDLGAVGGDEEGRELFEELRTDDSEDEVALRGCARYIHRYAQASLEPAGRRPTLEQGLASADTAFRLEVPQVGVLDRLTLREVHRPAPGPHQVEIQVRAAALNFSDVMKALGLYPGLPDGPVPLGIECAGRICAVGEGVTGLAVGDEVVALAPFSLGNYTLTYAPLVARKPRHLSFEEATTVPIAFLTAHYALNYLGRITSGERVLVHAASGGVGLAAIQLARRAGAEVFATAGSSEKRAFLASLGIEHVMDSRSLVFADEVMARTEGKGVDVVLNSLSGEAIGKGLSVLTDYGRFLEIGKRDIYMNTRLGLRPFAKNLSFIAIDLDQAMRQKPAVIAFLFQEVVREVEAGNLSALPHRVYSIGNVVSAFRCMAQAKHIGKVVVSLSDQGLRVARRPPAPMRFQAEASYLITGGLGGFGLAVARWMVEHGAKHLMLVGRRGAQSPEAVQAVDALRQAGAEVRVAAADVSDGAQVAAVLALVAAHMPPLQGIIHTAMALEDSLLTNLGRDLLMRVLRPRVHGAWHLHRQTAGMPLDFFVNFSSIASVFALPGQAPYVCSNTFLDALAHHRRSRQQAGLTVNWGYLSEVGYVARNEKVGERLEGHGLRSFSPREATTLLGRFLRHDPVQISVARIDWSRWHQLGAHLSPRFEHLCNRAKGGKDGQSGEGLAIRKVLLGAAPERRKDLLLEFLKGKVARVLGSSPDKVDLARPLTDLGLDSLMAVELRNWVEGELRVSLPVAELLQGPSVDGLATLLLEQLTKSEQVPASVKAPVAAPAEVPPGQPTEPSRSGTSKNGEAHRASSNEDAANSIDHTRAEELLARVDDLGAEEVDALLETLKREKESGS